MVNILNISSWSSPPLPPGGRIPRQCVANPLGLTHRSNPPECNDDDDDDYDDGYDGYDDDDDDDFLKWKKHLGLKEVYSLVCPLDLKSLKCVQNSIFKSW